MVTRVTQIAPDIHRISTFVPEWNLQFNQFLVADKEPLLFHTGMKVHFPAVRDAVKTVLDPASLRWICFSHFEVDECGALNAWLETAPQAVPACSVIGARVNLADFSKRPARELADNETWSTGKRRFRFLATPHFPHGWDAGLLFEETTGTLFCSDILHQFGDGEPVVETDLTAAYREALGQMAGGPLAGYLPYHKDTETYLKRLKALRPKILATMHGSAYRGDGAAALEKIGEILKQQFNQPA